MLLPQSTLFFADSTDSHVVVARPSRRFKSKQTGTGTCNTQSCTGACNTQSCTRCDTKHGKENCPTKEQKCHKCQTFFAFLHVVAKQRRKVSFKIDFVADVNVVSKRMSDSFIHWPTLQPTKLVFQIPGWECGGGGGGGDDESVRTVSNFNYKEHFIENLCD